MLAQSNTPYILLACTIFDLMLAQSHTPYILLACTIFDVGTVTVTHTLYFVSMYYI